MAFVLSTGAILLIGVVVFASYGFLHLIFGGSRPVAHSAAPAVRSTAPEWLTPVLFAGMIIMGFRAGMPWWIVIFGSMFAIVMFVKFGVLNFGATTPSAPPPQPMPPPLPRDDRFQNATYHPTYAPPAARSSGMGAWGVVCGILAVGGTILAVSFVREDRMSRNLRMSVPEMVRADMQAAKREIAQSMHDLKREIAEGAHEMAAGAHEVAAFAQEVKRAAAPPQAPVPTPPKLPQSPAIAPTEVNRIGEVLGRNGQVKVMVVEDNKKRKSGSKPKVQPQPKAPPQPPKIETPAYPIPHSITAPELADWGTDKSPNDVYLALSDPKDRRDDYQTIYNRIVPLLRNYLATKESGIDSNSFIIPPFAWAEANDLIHKRSERVDNYNVQALGVNFSPRSIDLAYNYHLGCVRTREAAKGYFGGLLLLGGLGLLLRIGTGVRPSPLPKV